MKIGANIGYVGLTGSPRDDLEFAREAERLGYESLWVGEPYGTDAVTVLGAFAAVTERILLGTGVMAMPGRTPAMTAQSAMTIDLMSGGRLLLGLGTSGPQVAEGWHGVAFTRPLLRTREYVDVVRMALRREQLIYDGQIIRLPLPGGAGKPLKLIVPPVRTDVPVYLAALGSGNLALCGEIADGWLPLWLSPEHAPGLMAPLAEGAAKAGRPIKEISVSPNVVFRVDDDVVAAREPAKEALALYIGGMGSRQKNFYNQLVSSYGYADECRRIQDLYLDGKRTEAVGEVPDDLVDLVCLCGPLERVADRLAAYHDFADRLVAVPAAKSARDRLEQLQLFAAAAELAA